MGRADADALLGNLAESREKSPRGSEKGRAQAGGTHARPRVRPVRRIGARWFGAASLGMHRAGGGNRFGRSQRRLPPHHGRGVVLQSPRRGRRACASSLPYRRPSRCSSFCSPAPPSLGMSPVFFWGFISLSRHAPCLVLLPCPDGARLQYWRPGRAGAEGGRRKGGRRRRGGGR